MNASDIVPLVLQHSSKEVVVIMKLFSIDVMQMFFFFFSFSFTAIVCHQDKKCGGGIGLWLGVVGLETGDEGPLIRKITKVCSSCLYNNINNNT